MNHVRETDLKRIFTYHPPQPSQSVVYQTIRDKAHELAKLIHLHCPRGHELDNALARVEESVMWANAGIARNPWRGGDKVDLDPLVEQAHAEARTREDVHDMINETGGVQPDP